MLGWDLEGHNAVCCSRYILVKAREELILPGLKSGTLLLQVYFLKSSPSFASNIIFPKQCALPLHRFVHWAGRAFCSPLLEDRGCEGEWGAGLLPCPPAPLPELTGRRAMFLGSSSNLRLTRFDNPRTLNNDIVVT